MATTSPEKIPSPKESPASSPEKIDYTEQTFSFTMTNDTPPVPSIKAPTFCKDCPNVWFTQMEAQFAIYGITTEKDKFNRIIASIETKIWREVEDLCISPPVENPNQ